MTVSRFSCAVNEGCHKNAKQKTPHREATLLAQRPVSLRGLSRKTEGQSNGLTLRQRDSERNGSGSSPELIGPGSENQTLLHNGSGIVEAGLRGTHEGYPLAAQLPVGAELIRVHARITLCPTMDRRPVVELAYGEPITGYPLAAQLPKKPN